MYLPTFWKLTAEATMYKSRHMAGWLMPVSFLFLWVGNASIYNWVFSTIIPPPRGVAKKELA